MVHLDKWAKINIQMDKQAKMYWQRTHETPVPNHQFGDENMSILFQGQKLSSFNKKELYKEIVGKKLKAYWQKKHEIPPELMDSIDWKTQEKALKNLPMGKQRWFRKFATGFIGVGKTLLTQDYQDHSDCPCCSKPGEDNKHVLLCQELRPATK